MKSDKIRLTAENFRSDPAGQMETASPAEGRRTAVLFMNCYRQSNTGGISYTGPAVTGGSAPRLSANSTSA